MRKEIEDILIVFIPRVEGFISKPYWDYKQWTWGYGTAAGFNRHIKPHGTITKEKALEDTVAYLRNDYEKLSKRIKVSLNDNQWAALLSFSYNEGLGNAENLIPNINTSSNDLEEEFKSYVFAGGERKKSLIERRNKEWALWSS